MLSRLEEAYIRKGLPVTDQRMLVMRLLANATDHPTMAQIYQRARLVDPFVSRATVMRAVRLAVDSGLVFVLEGLWREQFRYEDATIGHHEHLIDEATGEMINFESEELAALLASTAARLGYRLLEHRMMMTGRRLPQEPQND